MNDSQQGPVSRIDPRLAYARSAATDPVRLKLDANEGAEASIDAMLSALKEGGAELLRRYPDARELESTLARRHGIDRAQVFVTAGADEAIDRCCRAYLGPDTSVLLPDPTFEMFWRYATLAGGGLVTVPWPAGPFPIEAMLDRLDDRMSIVAMVTPNNPTGEVATADDLRRLATTAPRALVILDHAYVDYADDDLTATGLGLPNVVVLKTFSKAWGLAGCRVGYALGPAGIVATLRAAGGPFSVAAPSLAFTLAQLANGSAPRAAHVARVRAERADLYAFLAQRRAQPRRSQANFVYAELGPRATAVHAALVRQGVLVRLILDRSGAATGLRITVPADAGLFGELTAALDVALAGPDAGEPA